MAFKKAKTDVDRAKVDTELCHKYDFNEPDLVMSQNNEMEETKVDVEEEKHEETGVIEKYDIDVISEADVFRE